VRASVTTFFLWARTKVKGARLAFLSPTIGTFTVSCRLIGHAVYIR